MGVAGALQKEYMKDQAFFLDLLARTLQAALPNETEIKTRGFLKKSLAAVYVDFGDYRYGFEKPERGPVIATRIKVVKGIALKTEEMPIEQGLEELSLALEERAAKSAAARNALSATLGLS